MIQLNFLGAAGEVGASGIYIDNGVEKILMDYGVEVEETPPRPPLPPPGKIDGLLLTHAHLDHCGAIPILKKKQEFPIFALPCTKELAHMLLKDSLKINIETVGSMEAAKLQFTKHDINKTMKNFVDVGYKKIFNIHKAKVQIFDAGHIPGSYMCHVDLGEKKILYTGNHNTVDTRLLKKADTNLPKTDILITESTYSDRDHPDRKMQEKELLRIVEETISNGGVSLISSFAIGRSQEILLILHDRGFDYPVYMDGMAKKATTIINKHRKLLKDPNEIDEALKNVKYVTDNQMRSKIIKQPCAIITTSGMLNGGPVVNYISKLHDDENSSLLLTGFQAPNTGGKVLLDTGRFILEENKIDVQMKMFYKRLDFSAHLGRKELFAFIEKINPEKVFCVHGEKTEEFANELKQKGFDAVAPLANNRTFTV